MVFCFTKIGSLFSQTQLWLQFYYLSSITHQLVGMLASLVLFGSRILGNLFATAYPNVLFVKALSLLTRLHKVSFNLTHPWQGMGLPLTRLHYPLTLIGWQSTILVVVDRLSKQAHFSALGPYITALMVADIFVRDIVHLHGIIRDIFVHDCSALGPHITIPLYPIETRSL